MNILLAIDTYYPDGRAGGTGTWCDTMAAALTKMGHSCTVADVQQPQNGYHLWHGDRCVGVDLALVAHNTTLKFLNSVNRVVDCPKIYTCHGIIPDLEQPCEGADYYVGVSEETAAHIGAKGFPCAGVIRNPIDCQHFKPRTDRPFDNTAYFYSRYRGEVARGKFIASADSTNFTPNVWGPDVHRMPKTLPNYLSNMAVICATGRSALEAMACGRPTVVFGYGHSFGGVACDGYATPGNLPELAKHNYSGRRYGNRDLAEELGKYDPSDGAGLRDWVVENHAADKIAQAYLDLVK